MILIVTVSVVVDQAIKQTMHCDDLKKISNMTETPKIIIIGKIVLKFHRYKLFLNFTSYWLERCSLVLSKRNENV